MPTITLEKVTKYYKIPKKHRRGTNRVEVGVEDVDLTVEQGEFVFLVGSSGAGKSTLLDLITVEENLRIAAMIGRRRFESARHVDERIRKVLGLVGMRGAEKKYPGELSIGECRRVELARAMINSPPILVLDEITANLDDDNIWDMIILLNEVNRRGTTVIMATHASKYVNIMRRRVITLVDGHIFGDVERGRYGDVV